MSYFVSEAESGVKELFDTYYKQQKSNFFKNNSEYDSRLTFKNWLEQNHPELVSKIGTKNNWPIGLIFKDKQEYLAFLIKRS